MIKQKDVELKNPFLVYGYVSPRYFCDREEETERMLSALDNGRNLTLIAPRRIGKAGLLEENSPIYQNLIALLTDNQLSLMQAIAIEGLVTSPNSGEFIKRHGLKTPSSVNAALKSLLEKELLYKSASGYMVYDRFMGLWLQTL